MLSLFIIPVLSPVRQITIDLSRSTKISPYIYGVNYPDSFIQQWTDEWKAHHDGFKLAREGGNRFTAYNWETNASNAGADYFNENDDYLSASSSPGWTVREFLEAVQPTGAAALLTVPTLGYVSADKVTEMNGSRDVGKTPNYLDTRFVNSYPVKPGGRLSNPPDTSDKAVYEDEFVAWVKSIASPKSPVWFSLDNEPDFWAHTHSRLETKPTTYARIIENNIAYSNMIKSVYPEALVFGPVNYGWQGQKTFQNAPDADGRQFVPTYLTAMRAAGKKAGRRLLDVYDFHYYPEESGDGVRIIWDSRPNTAATNVARIQTPRALWDPNFVEENWITKSLGGEPLMLLPRVRRWIKSNYPGTKMAVTEYDFGGRKSISGPIAQADALGLFGRYGVFAACHWGLTHIDTAACAAFHAYTDFDGKGSKFGDLELRVKGEEPAIDSVYASRDSHNKNRLTLVTINKSSEPLTLAIGLKGLKVRKVRGFLIEDGSFDSPRETACDVTTTGVTVKLPPLSIETIEVQG